MTRWTFITISGLGLILANAAMAGDASTSANATNGWGTPGTAGATADWSGGDDGRGFARTHSNTGNVNTSRGVAFGVDDEGMDLSFSHAIAPKQGPAYAGTLNMSIGNNGQVTGSYGGVIANGGTQRAVESGGSTTSRPGGAATATATGDTRHGGTVQANTHAYQNGRQTVARRGTPVRGHATNNRYAHTRHGGNARHNATVRQGATHGRTVSGVVRPNKVVQRSATPVRTTSARSERPNKRYSNYQVARAGGARQYGYGR